MEKAIAAVTSSSLSQRKSALKYKVNRYTLAREVKATVTARKHRGRRPVLGFAFEAAIVAVFSEHACNDLPLPTTDVAIVARKIAQEAGMLSFKACERWIRAFKDRPPGSVFESRGGCQPYATTY